MNPQQLKRLAAVVVGLLALWGLMAVLPSRTDRPTAAFRLPRVAAESVLTITLTTPADTMVLARAAGSDSSWTVNGLAASRSGVEELIATFGEPVQPELVANSPASFARLGVDSTASRRVRVLGRAGALLDLIVSARGVGFEGTYLRVPGDSAVYAWSGRLGQLVRRGLDDWRDRVIARVTTDSVRRIEVMRGARRYVLRHQDGRWWLDGVTADSSAAARLLEALHTVTASGFATDAQRDSAFRGRMERRVLVYGAAGAPLVALEFDSTSGAFWVRRSGNETIYRLNPWNTEQLTPADSTLRKR